MSHERNRAGRRTLVRAAAALSLTVACTVVIESAGSVLWGDIAEGAIAGVIWGLVLGLVWVLPVAFLGRSGEAKKKWHGYSPRQSMRAPGRFGGSESGGFF
jgi:hypothetical protein